MGSFLDDSVNSDGQFLLNLMIGGYLLSFLFSFLGSFPIGLLPPPLSNLLEALFVTLTIYSALVSVWIFYLSAEHAPQLRIFLIVACVILFTTSLLLISANFFSPLTHYLRAIAVLLIGITPLFSLLMCQNHFSRILAEIRGVIVYLVVMALFLLSWGIQTSNLFTINLIRIVAILYTLVALVSLFLTLQIARQEEMNMGLLLLPSFLYVVIGGSVGLYVQWNAPESFRLFEMIISEPWRWTIGYDMPIFSTRYNFLFYLVFPAAVLPLGWILLKKTLRPHATSWRYILFGWIILFICGAGSSDAFEMIGKLIGYSLFLLGVLNIVSIQRRGNC